MKKIYVYKFKICNLFQSLHDRKFIKSAASQPPACNLIEYAIAEEDGAICGVSGRNIKKESSDAIIEETALIKRTAKQIEEYLNKKREYFDIPLNLKGTEFQLKVWNTLKKIPYGETRSYKEIAEKIGNPKGCRAVGMANNKNPIAIIIPCHRVIGANGNLTGYAGGLEIKQALLELEKSNK